MASIKAKKVFQKVVKGSSISKAMREVGYAPSTAARTNKLTETDGWKELLNKYIPDEDLVRVHKEGLQATKLSGTGGMRMTMGSDGNLEQFGHSDLEIPDYPTRHKYLETGYKIKGKIKEAEDPVNKIPLQTIIVINAPSQVAIKQ